MKLRIKYKKEVEKQIGGVDIFEVPLYKCEIGVLQGATARKLAALWGKESENYGAWVMNYLTFDGSLLVFFPHNTVQSKHIAHESVHLTQHILDFIGHRGESEYDEPFAYLTEYIYEEIVKTLKKKKVKIQL